MNFRAFLLFNIWIISFCFILTSCAGESILQPASFDHLIGKKFSESIDKGHNIFTITKETDTTVELEYRRFDGCILVFGVRKLDDIIEYWRIDSGPGTCLMHKRPINM